MHHTKISRITSQSRFNAIAIAIAAKSNSGIRLQFVNNMHNSNKKRNVKANAKSTSKTKIEFTNHNKQSRREKS
jgi:hypothetical protein